MRHDLVHAARVLWRARTTSGIAILTLAAGIGFAVAVFSVADRVLFRPLPYLVPDQLVELRLAGLQMGNLPLSGRELASARSAPIFSAAEGYDTGGVVTRVDGPEPERIRLAHVTPGLLPLLGARIAHGRPLQPSDGAAGAEPVALLEHGFWQTRYGADPAVVGRVIRFDEGVALRVVGVLERDFVFPTTTPSSSPQVIETISEAQLAEDGRWLTVIARLHPGLQPSAADGALPVDSPPAGSQVHIASRPLHEALGYGARRGLIALLVGALALLLIGGLDVAGLLVAQATTRDREMAVRRALGAGTWPLVRQVLVEGGILAALSCAFGLLLAQWLFDSLMALVPPDLQLMQPAGVDLRGALVALAASAALTMLFGAAPLLHVRRTGTTAVLRSGATQTPSRVVRRFGSALVGAQIAIALVLVIAGGLLLTSFWNVRSIDVGVEAGGLALVKTGLPRSQWREAQAFYPDALARIRALEGVDSAAAIDAPLFELSYRRTRFRPVGRPAINGTGRVNDIQSAVTDGYFETMRIPMREGRSFGAADMREAAEPVAIVSESLARRWWPDTSAVGQTIAFRNDTRTVVGVAGDVRQVSPKMDAPGELYVPMIGADAFSTATLVVRSADPRRALEQTVATARTMAPGIVIVSAVTADQRLAAGRLAERFYALLLGIVAAAGLGLAALGAYGMLEWSIGRRRREFGIRAALGATPRDIAVSVARQLAWPFALGSLTGLLAARWGTQLLASLLFEVQPGSAGVWTAAGLMLSLMLLGAAAVPARRAGAVSPANALRTE